MDFASRLVEYGDRPIVGRFNVEGLAIIRSDPVTSAVTGGTADANANRVIHRFGDRSSNQRGTHSAGNAGVRCRTRNADTWDSPGLLDFVPAFLIPRLPKLLRTVKRIDAYPFVSLALSDEGCFRPTARPDRFAEPTVCLTTISCFADRWQ